MTEMNNKLIEEIDLIIAQMQLTKSFMFNQFYFERSFLHETK